MAGRDKVSSFLFSDLVGRAERPGRMLEDRLQGQGFQWVAGVDEAGRGPLAGPVVAAAVVLDQGCEYPGVGDSKKIGAAGRKKAFHLILRQARAIGVGLVGPEEIDRINILQAALKAMLQAVMKLDPRPDFVIVDGSIAPPFGSPCLAVPQGDALCLSIGAASIVAKVVRDRLMTAYDRLFPEYGFAAHKGYATRTHLEALACHGPCPLHRLSFKGVRIKEEGCLDI